MSMKLLDYGRIYGRIYPFGPIAGSPTNIAWPVNSFRVTLPQKNKANLLDNPFEKLILRFIDADCQITEKKLSVETCLPQALVHEILSRLHEHGYLDESGHVVGSKKLEWSDVSASADSYVTAVVFQDLMEGKILPYIHFISNDSPLKTFVDDELNFLKKLPFDPQKEFPEPEPSEILQALREMKNRGRNRGEKYSFPAISQIQIMPQAERYYLKCPIAIQKSDGDFRIADPFGNGYSMLLENIFSNLLEKDDNLAQWYKNWVNSLGRGFISDDEKKARYCFDTPELRSKYPKLIQNNLCPKKYHSFRTIEQIYAALEWTLFYFCRQFPCDSAIQMMKFQDSESMNKELLKISKKFCFSAKKFTYVRGGKLLDFIQEKAEMPTLIALSLILADQNTQARKFFVLIAKKFPDFFDRIKQIKESRDRIEHGATKQLEDVELIDDAFLKEIISILLPDIPLSDSSDSNDRSQEALFDIKITARLNIINSFSFSVYNRLGETSQQRLISAEMFWLSNEKQSQCENVMPFISDLYAALQIAFRPHLYANLPPEIANDNLISFAAQKINETGFAPLPEYFNHVSLERINMTLQGQDQSLGAAVVAFILVSAVEKLVSIARCQPNFFFNIAEIIMIRGHGNEIVSKTHDELAGLKKAAYNTIKILMEV